MLQKYQSNQKFQSAKMRTTKYPNEDFAAVECERKTQTQHKMQKTNEMRKKENSLNVEQ